jgi:hypothetical protein
VIVIAQLALMLPVAWLENALTLADLTSSQAG